MHLVAFLLAGPTAHHHGAWRHPEADLGVFTPQWHEHIARVLELGKFDSLFFADILGLYDLFGGNFATILRCGGQMGLLDPIPLLSIMSRVTSRIGLGATLSSTFYPPYHLARSARHARSAERRPRGLERGGLARPSGGAELRT